MKLRLLNALVFTSLAVWAVVMESWIAPFFGLFATAQWCLLIGAWRKADGAAARFFLFAFLGAGYAALAYLVALLAGNPREPAFWAVFGAGMAILAPIVVLARRTILRRPRPKVHSA